ncbi:MAG: sulfotransferase [Sphingomonas sp.]|nr:sulfotransferase [Sphingomonas sp.]
MYATEMDMSGREDIEDLVEAGGRQAAWPTQRFACIVGAPRCGTTTLSRLMRSHPAISFSSVKEPHFFSLADLSGLSDDALRQAVAEHYVARYFPDIEPNAQLIAEGSVSYLYAPERLLPVLALWPDAKFVIAVRDPLQMIPSLHRRLLYQGDETVEDFARAWALIAERRAGRKIPRSCVDARQLMYDEAARLGQHVSRFFEVVGRERCHVVLFDDLKTDPERVHRDLIHFLSLPTVPMPELSARRESRGYRIAWLQRLLKRPPLARTVLAGEKFRRRVSSAPARQPSQAARAVMRARKSLVRWNSAPAPPVSVPAELEREIRNLLAEDVLLLSTLIGRDLRHWLGGLSRRDAAFERAA